MRTKIMESGGKMNEEDFGFVNALKMYGRQEPLTFSMRHDPKILLQRLGRRGLKMVQFVPMFLGRGPNFNRSALGCGGEEGWWLINFYADMPHRDANENIDMLRGKKWQCPIVQFLTGHCRFE